MKRAQTWYAQVLRGLARHVKINRTTRFTHDSAPRYAGKFPQSLFVLGSDGSPNNETRAPHVVRAVAFSTRTECSGCRDGDASVSAVLQPGSGVCLHRFTVPQLFLLTSSS